MTIRTAGTNDVYEGTVSNFCSGCWDRPEPLADIIHNGEITIYETRVSEAERHLRPFCKLTRLRSFFEFKLGPGNIDINALIAAHLDRFAPLILVYRSLGSNCLTAWSSSKGFCDISGSRFCEYAVECGAKRASWDRFDWIELPNTLTNGGSRAHELVYLNPFNANK